MGPNVSGGISAQNTAQNYQQVASDNQTGVQDIKVKKSFSEFD